MTEPKSDSGDAATRPISVAELLAKNGSIGSPPVTGRRRRRRGNADAVTVAELTGEIPIIRDDQGPPEPVAKPDTGDAESGALPVGPAPGFVADDRPATGPRPVERTEATARPKREPRWPKSPPQTPRGSGPEPSAYPRPIRRSEAVAAAEETVRPAVAESAPAESTTAEPAGSGAERMLPDPLDGYPDLDVDVMDDDVRDPDLPVGDSAFVRSILSETGDTERSTRRMLGVGLDPADDVAAGPADTAEPDDDYVGRPGVLGGILVVLQSLLAVVLGGGLFVAFDQLWRWNSIVALVLTGLVTLGLVAAVQAVRKTPDLVSTLIAVAVGLLVTLGPLALHAN